MDFKIIYNKVIAWFKDLPNKIKRLPETLKQLPAKFKALPKDHQYAWIGVGVGILLMIISLFLI